LYPVRDQAFQYLALQHIARGELGALALQLAFDARHPGLQLERGNDFVIDYGNHPIDFNRLRAPGLRLYLRQHQGGQRSNQEQTLHCAIAWPSPC
jgi:hypothetical protein